MAQSQTQESVFSRINGILEKGLGQLFITASSSQFFNKTDFEQYLAALYILAKRRTDG